MSARKRTKAIKESAKARFLASCHHQSFQYVVHIFSEGETELRYFRELAAKKCVKVIPENAKSSSPHVLMQAARNWAFAQRDLFDTKEPSEEAKHVIWVLFDDDEKTADIQLTISELGNAPEGATSSALKKYSAPVIHVGYMKPCIELWGALCVLGKSSGLPKTHRAMESALSRIMRGYDHGKNRYFDLTQMKQTKKACRAAAAWSKTYGLFPSCVNAAYYAGIHELVSLIESCDNRG